MNIGEKYGMLTVIKEVDRLILPSGQTNRAFLCKCDCGKEHTVRLLHLKRMRIKSCGCAVRTRNGEGGSLLCKVWRQMNSRCKELYFEKHLYFEKGIKVCDEWKNDFELFKKWSLSNGYEKGLQIDRRDNSKGYSPENCRWVTPEINVNNKDNTFYIVYKGEKQSLRLLLSKLGRSKDYATIRGRLSRGYDGDKAIDKPITKGNYSKTNFTKIARIEKILSRKT